MKRLFLFFKFGAFWGKYVFLMKVFGVFLIAKYPVDQSVVAFIKTAMCGQILGTLQPNLEEYFKD